MLRSFRYCMYLSLFLSVLISCEGNLSDEGDDIVTYITINSNSNQQFVGQEFIFSVIDNLNQDITEQSEIYLDGALMEGNSISFSEQGTHEVKAIWNGFESTVLNIEVIISEGVNFKQRILYEDYTGTWCGYCPLAYVRYENLIEQNENVVFVGVHGPSNTNDPYTNATATSLDELIGVVGRPAMFVNRTVEWPYNNADYTDLSVPIAEIQPFSKIGIEINSTLNGDIVNAQVNLAFAANFSNLRLVNYIVEDNLYYPQRNYFNGANGTPLFYDGVYEIENYYHKNVLRDSSDGIEGVSIPNDASMEGEIYNYNFTYTIPTNIVNENVRLISLVINENGKVLNVREVHVNSENTYEVL